jgi:predicted RNA polymerase sigma factor
VACYAEVDATRADLNLRLAKLDELHNAYQDALGLKLHSEDGEQ